MIAIDDSFELREMENIVCFVCASSLFPKKKLSWFLTSDIFFPKSSQGHWILLTSAKPTSLARCCRIPAAHLGSVLILWVFPSSLGQTQIDVGNHPFLHR